MKASDHQLPKTLKPTAGAMSVKTCMAASLHHACHQHDQAAGRSIDAHASFHLHDEKPPEVLLPSLLNL